MRVPLTAEYLVSMWLQANFKLDDTSGHILALQYLQKLGIKVVYLTRFELYLIRVAFPTPLRSRIKETAGFILANKSGR
jgi:hypothetical protein